ncbi:MAG: 5-formyltetrahydrofolate cyclo-ligase [Lentisphaeria bacterium]|nr:5-formyltetrahydrofolate cyclo-ligase [Lentisphaeria bacterium]NQZ68035.1 5-formyltetrahydrofolate cyclo-ligase [Lentisphaeria bacterium]
MNKTDLRLDLKTRLAKLTAQEHTAHSAAVVTQLADLLLHRANTIVAYMHIQHEIDITDFLKQCLRKGKRLAFPRYNPAKDDYEIAEIKDLKTDLTLGNFGVKEPLQACPLLDTSAAICLVPGLGFSLNADRLGRGKGFYDNLLANSKMIKIGIAHHCQIVDDIPREPHDISMDMLLTESSVDSFNGALR